MDGKIKEIENAFQQTTKLIFGEAINDFYRYEEWLARWIPSGAVLKSATNGKEIYLPDYSAMKFIPHERVADEASIEELSKRKIEISDAESIDSISKKLSEKTLFVCDVSMGTNVNVHKSCIYLNLSNAYRTVDCFNSKNIACSFWSDRCDYSFGVCKSFNCNFCINCNNSRDLTRCLEVDFSKNCSDVMFCHNCDNVRESLFCFNTKNKRYAIANVEVGKDKYIEIKKKLIEYIINELKTKQTLDIDIYNIGCR